MSVWGTDPGIPGYKYPGSQYVPEDVQELPRVPDAVMVATVRMDEGFPEEVTSGYLRLSVVGVNYQGITVDVDVLLDVAGVRKLRRQLSRFIQWRESKEERR